MRELTKVRKKSLRQRMRELKKVRNQQPEAEDERT